MSSCSVAFARILNLRHAAVQHKATCNSAECAVSVRSLADTAIFLKQFAWPEEQPELDVVIGQMPRF